MIDELEFPDGEATDDDPEVVAGMQKLRALREAEDEIPDLLKRRPD